MTSKFVLKIANAPRSGLYCCEAQNRVCSRHLAERVSFGREFCQRLIGRDGMTVNSKDILFASLTYLPGMPLAEVKPHTPGLLQDLGQKLGQLSHALADFDHPAVHRDFHWDLANGNRIVNELCAGLIRRC